MPVLKRATSHCFKYCVDSIFVQVDERVITLIGEMRGNQIALDMILEKVCEDPNALSCGDIHYTEHQAGGALHVAPSSGYGYGSRGGSAGPQAAAAVAAVTPG